MGARQDLIDKYGQDVRITSKKKGPYRVHVALREFDDGTVRMMGIKADKTRPALLGLDSFFKPNNLPAVMGNVDIDRAIDAVNQRI